MGETVCVGFGISIQALSDKGRIEISSTQFVTVRLTLCLYLDGIPLDFGSSESLVWIIV
ncbi:hypothetical protein GCM10010982_07990 [Bowmanella pacifica]|uniref:Uncharacterized protein n=1 Tax=Bowmanella pacifica TaxID=502051 RepID=A0A917YVM8_9ALTE|nr:hypothetical protein GCM10010982_07990 [Bowmanella pacifica]